MAQQFWVIFIYISQITLNTALGRPAYLTKNYDIFFILFL